MNKREIEKRRKRMRAIVARFQDYVRTYSEQAHFEDYSDETFLSDMLYGIGIAMEPKEWREGKGFDAFRAMLRERLAPTSTAQQPEAP